MLLSKRFCRRYRASAKIQRNDAHNDMWSHFCSVGKASFIFSIASLRQIDLVATSWLRNFVHINR